MRSERKKEEKTTGRDEKNASSNQIGRNIDKYLSVGVDRLTLTVMIEKKWRNEKLRKHKINGKQSRKTNNSNSKQQQQRQQPRATSQTLSMLNLMIQTITTTEKKRKNKRVSFSLLRTHSHTLEGGS